MHLLKPTYPKKTADTNIKKKVSQRDSPVKAYNLGLGDIQYLNQKT